MANIDDILFEDVEKQQDIEIPHEIRNLTTQAYDKSVSDIVRMISDKDLILDPDYQRNYVWDNKKASKLIESIILNVPIPVIYVSEEQDSSWSVIDGLQRLNSLKRFFDGKYKLSGLEVLYELNKCDIKTLPAKARRMLKNGLLRIVMVTADSNNDIKYDIFMRLNTGSVHLNEQELRNCLYRGRMNSFIQEEARNTQWLAMLGLGNPHKRMTDRELLLRFLALSVNWDRDQKQVIGYKGNIKSFLNAFMKNHQNDSGSLNYFRTLCRETIAKVYEVYGNDAFRRLNEDGSVTPINRAIMDAVMISVIPYTLGRLIEKKEQLKEALFNNLNENNGFRQSTLTATSDTKVLNSRISFWCGVVDEIMK
ncbi:MAG: DUF262 domain-containing protein [Prevotella sp.]|nr:DUF262 domain-containing protein [Prevotella sp.]